MTHRYFTAYCPEHDMLESFTVLRRGSAQRADVRLARTLGADVRTVEFDCGEHTDLALKAGNYENGDPR